MKLKESVSCKTKSTRLMAAFNAIWKHICCNAVVNRNCNAVVPNRGGISWVQRNFHFLKVTYSLYVLYVFF